MNKLFWMTAAGALILGSVAVMASNRGENAEENERKYGEYRDVDEARDLRDAGTIVPLEKITADARERYPGRVLEVELERERGGYHYEVEMLDQQGIVWVLRYDAHSGEFLNDRIDD